jgi:hypothetical protein
VPFNQKLLRVLDESSAAYQSIVCYLELFRLFAMSQKQQESVWGSLKALDAFPKVNEDFFQRTMSGGIITIVSSIFMFILFMSEVRKWLMTSLPPAVALREKPTFCCPYTGLFLTTQTSHELTVDTSRGETITIHVCLSSLGTFCLGFAQSDP